MTNSNQSGSRSAEPNLPSARVAKQFSDKVIAYQKSAGRHDLPWQQNPTPYRVWVSEIMLQQTQVATVIPYYQSFTTRFPDVATLAKATDDQVMHSWSGLGYYSRARNLHQSAKLIVSEHDGIFPNSIDKIIELPGIGLSTAGAIASLSMGIPAAILDGNVKRVLARVFEVPGWPGQSKTLKRLWEISERVTPKRSTATFNQGMMDLGSQVCTRGKPSCAKCPLIGLCGANARGTQPDYPGRKPKKDKPVREGRFLVALNDNGELRLVKRPPAGIWGGLWCLPELDGVTRMSANEAKRDKRVDNSVEMLGKVGKTLPSLKHSFSHYDLIIQPVLVRSEHLEEALAGGNLEFTVNEPHHAKWQSLNTIESIGLPAPITKVIDGLIKALKESGEIT